MRRRTLGQAANVSRNKGLVSVAVALTSLLFPGGAFIGASLVGLALALSSALEEE